MAGRPVGARAPRGPGAPGRPALGTTYGGRDPALLERILPSVGYIEVTPDSIARVRGGGVGLDGPTISELKNISAQVKILVHGVGLSIGSHEGYSRQYIRLLDSFFEQVDVAWHSEHLAYTTVDGEHLGTMLALPKTEQVLDLVSERVREIQARYGRPFLLENVAHLLPESPADYTEAGFLNALVAGTGCGLIVDVYNMECDAHNLGFDIEAFLGELDFSSVRELHLAGGVEHRGFLLDVHSRLTRESTIDLAKRVLATPGQAVQALTYELLPEAVPILGHEAVAAELGRLRGRLL